MMKKKLQPLRRKINKIDDNIANLLKKRSYIIPKVRKIKHGGLFKIAFKREAEMAINLKRKDFGLYKNPYIQKIWREIISATLHIECGLKVLVYKNSNNYHDMWEIAKDNWGTASNISLENDEEIIFEKLLAKEAECAIFAMPKDSNNAWWLYLQKQKFKGIRINLLLPFISEFKTLNNCEGFCLSLNNQDIFNEQLFYIIKQTSNNIIDDYILVMDEKMGYCFVKSTLSANEISEKLNITLAEINFVGSSVNRV